MFRLSRREFLRTSAAVAGGLASPPPPARRESRRVFKFSLAQWSLHRAFCGQRASPKLDAPPFSPRSPRRITTSTPSSTSTRLYASKKGRRLLKDLRRCRRQRSPQRAHHVRRDGASATGHKKRQQAVENHYRGVIGRSSSFCHSIRVTSPVRPQRHPRGVRRSCRLRLASLRFLREARHRVIVENHGGLVGRGRGWRTDKMVDHKISARSRLRQLSHYDRTRLDSYAVAKVRAKSHAQRQGRGDEDGLPEDEEIVVKSTTTTVSWIEYEWRQVERADGIRATGLLRPSCIALRKRKLRHELRTRVTEARERHTGELDSGFPVLLGFLSSSCSL